MITTRTGYKLYIHFQMIQHTGVMPSDVIDVTTFENWFIAAAEKIKAERQQILINSLEEITEKLNLLKTGLSLPLPKKF